MLPSPFPTFRPGYGAPSNAVSAEGIREDRDGRRGDAGRIGWRAAGPPKYGDGGKVEIGQEAAAERAASHSAEGVVPL
jgi:hypothetical protein